MKNEINLLPPSALLKRMEKIQKRRLRALFLCILASCSIVLAGYGTVWLQLRSLQVSITDETQSRNKDRTAITEGNRIINVQISELDGRTASYILWTRHIPDIVNAAPKGMLISRLELVEESGTLVVTGTAAQGSDVVAYQADLEKLSWVERVVTPLQNFARSPEAVATFTIVHKNTPSP